LSAWARASTSPDAVFLFADAGKQLQPGIFRSEALRAVYVDWKGGGQVNYLTELGEQWWSRWQQVMAAPFEPRNVARYGALGIDYIVLSPRNRLPDRAPIFENASYLAYPVAHAPVRAVSRIVSTQGWFTNTLSRLRAVSAGAQPSQAHRSFASIPLAADYIVLSLRNRLTGRAPLLENAEYLVYGIISEVSA
jgi:hypothetical protein